MDTDWASQELCKAGQGLAECSMVDPITFEIDSEPPGLRVNGDFADSYSAYILRGFNRRGEIDYQYEIFELLDREGVVVVNSPSGISLAESKAQTTFVLGAAGLPVPRTVVTQDLDRAAEAVSDFGKAVIKPLYGSFGIGIERVCADACDELLPAFMQDHGVAYIQEYIPNEGRDIRAFVVGNEIPAAMYRVAGPGQWKTNVFQGAACKACELSPLIQDMCLEAARIAGLDYTGVDVVEGPDGPVILELNGTPSWYGLFEATGRNVAVDIMSHVIQAADEGRPARLPLGLHFRAKATDMETYDTPGVIRVTG